MASPSAQVEEKDADGAQDDAQCDANGNARFSARADIR